MGDPQLSSRRVPYAALLSPVFLGLAPVFGKLALRGGSDPFTVAAARTTLAALLLWGLYFIFWRQYIFIYTAGFLGCAVVGAVNGIGSLMYYNGLSRLDASIAQLLNGSYLLFVVLLTRMSGRSLSRRTQFRVGLVLFGLLLITGGARGPVEWLGIGLMLGNALLFAGTLVLSQRILWEMPAQTVTLYVMTVMAVVVVMARLVYDLRWLPQTSQATWGILALTISTALSRLALFAGVKNFGSLLTTLLAMTETAVAVILSVLFLDERLNLSQVLGVGLLITSLFLHNRTFDDVPSRVAPMPNMAGIVFQQIAFMHAFGYSGMSQDELDSLRHTMGVGSDLPSEPPLHYGGESGDVTPTDSDSPVAHFE